MDVDNETTGTVHTPDPLETLLAGAAKPDSVVKELEERRRREQEKLEMQAAAKSILTRQAPELTSDAKTPGQVTSNVTPKGKDKNVSTTTQNAQASSSNAETFTPVSVSPPQPRIHIARSQRFSLFAPVTDFTTDDPTAIKKSLYNLYATSTQLTDIQIVPIKQNKDITVNFVIVTFCSMDDAYKAKATPIPGTEKSFEFYSNKRSQLVEIVSASSDENTSAKQPIVPLKDFVNHTANKKDRDSRTVKLQDIPLSFSQDSIHAAMSCYGKVVSVRLNTKNAWQQAFVEFESADSVSPFYDDWGFLCLKHFIKATPLVLPQDQWELRSKHVLKLTGLPPGTTFIDLIDIISAVDAKSCVIPKGLKAYQPRPFAYIAFSSESKMLKALKTSYSLVNSDLTWVTTKQKLCGICGSPSHLAKACPKNKTKSNKKYQTIYERYKPANYQKYLPKKTQQSSSQRSSRPWNDANVKKGVSYASMASPRTDDLTASIHNPENKSQSSQSQQQNQIRRPKTNSAFEATVLDQLESINKNFDKIFKRMENFEARLNAIDEFLEDQFQLNPEGDGLTEDDYFARQQDIIVDQPEPLTDDLVASSDSHFGRSTMPHIPMTSNQSKRSTKEAEFSSPEDTPAYKLLRSHLDQQKKVTEHVLTENTALREEYKALKAMVLNTIPRETGMFT